jgi:hypothetical protein
MNVLVGEMRPERLGRIVLLHNLHRARRVEIRRVVDQRDDVGPRQVVVPHVLSNSDEEQTYGETRWNKLVRYRAGTTCPGSSDEYQMERGATCRATHTRTHTHTQTHTHTHTQTDRQTHTHTHTHTLACLNHVCVQRWVIAIAANKRAVQFTCRLKCLCERLASTALGKSLPLQ